MTRTEAGHRLLALGPLNFTAFHEITGWSKSTAHWVLAHLETLGIVERFRERGDRQHSYRLAHESGARA
jgi:DNA-binding transcriptional regulator GbsR (MarR family)